MQNNLFAYSCPLNFMPLILSRKQVAGKEESHSHMYSERLKYGFLLKFHTNGNQ